MNNNIIKPKYGTYEYLKEWNENYPEKNREYNQKPERKIKIRANYDRYINKITIKHGCLLKILDKDRSLTKKEKINLYERNKYNKEVEYKIMKLLRSRLTKALNYNVKSKHTMELLGCSIDFLKQHLESQFQLGMSWTNNTKDGWHIDHIIPCDSFDLSKEEEQLKCFHYTNLQPLWSLDNWKKGVNILYIEKQIEVET